MSQEIKIDYSVQTRLFDKQATMVADVSELERKIQAIELKLNDFFKEGNYHNKLIGDDDNSIAVYRKKIQQMLRTFEVSQAYVYNVFQTMVDAD